MPHRFIPLGDSEVMLESEFVALSETDKWIYIYRYLSRIDNNTRDVVAWSKNIKGSVVIISALGELGKWCLYIGAVAGAIKLWMMAK